MSWRHDRWVPSCVASLAASGSPAVTIATVTVVDNAASLGALETPPGIGTVALLGNHVNAGFARACNQGARLGTAEYLLFLNPDTRVMPGALAHAVSAVRAQARTDVGIVGLQIVDFDGHVQRTCGRFPQLTNSIVQLLGVSRVAPRLFPGFRMTEWDHTSTRSVDFACGAALLVRRALFEQLAGFDERLFIYLEDADLSMRARALGWRTLFCAEAQVQHACGWSVGDDRAWRLAQSWRSELVYARAHFSRAAALLLTVLVMVAGPLARLVEAAIRMQRGSARDAVTAWFLLLQLLAAEHRGRTPATGSPEAPLTPSAPAPRQA